MTRTALLESGELPALQAEIERLRVAAGAPRMNGIYIDGDLNAAAVSIPRALGLLGYRHYLVLGLPLMQLLSVDQFRAVVAHEFGHFGGRHGHFSGWIYRVRLGWVRVIANLLARESWASAIYRRFFAWYGPYFSAYSYVLARRNEFQADAMAARLTDIQAAGQALILTHLGAHRLEKGFWASIAGRMHQSPLAPTGLYTEMQQSLRTPHADDTMHLQTLLQQPGDPDDTHPPLALRLAALGVDPQLPASDGISAAQSLLGPLLQPLQTRFSDEWHAANVDAWAETHARLRADADRLDELQWKEQRSEDEHVEQADLIAQLHPDVDAVQLWRRTLALAPQHPVPLFRLGEALLEHGHGEAVELLRQAARIEPAAQSAALEVIAQFHRRAGDDGQLDQVGAELHRLEDERRRALRAHLSVTRHDALEPHGLDHEQLERFREQLASLSTIGRAWLVRKQQRSADGIPLYVVLVRLRGMILREQAVVQGIVDRIELPGSVVVVTTKDSRGLVCNIRETAESPCWQRS